MKKITKKIVSIVVAISVVLTISCPIALAVSGNIDREIVAQTRQTAIDIESEGIVLLKNEDNALPLEGKKINVFGAGSVCPFLGGAGSGAITTENPTDFYEALDAEKIEYNSELRALYEEQCGSNEMPKTDNTVINNLLQLLLAKSSLTEMDMKYLDDGVMSRAKAFSETAVIMISRTGAENSDLSPEVLRLNDDEKALVEKVTSTFDEVIVLFNTANLMEMGWIEDYENIKAAALIWIPGEFGLTGVAKMLKGEVNPSGKLADTVVYNVEDHPSGVCFGTNQYEGADEYYVQYLEGIYIGYRYFETFAKDKVQFPFGYGLSYTNFEKRVVSYEASSDKITVKAEVKNIGNRSGKDTVQLYYSAPYYSGGIEKSAIVLGGYAKTKLLAPGESEVLTVELDVRDMASYDQKTYQAWVLEKGDYKIIIAENVREHIASYDYTVLSDVVYKRDSATNTEISNLFADAYNGFTVLSRENIAETYPIFKQLVADDSVKNIDIRPQPVSEGEIPKMGVVYEDGPITLEDVYNDEGLWDAFLDQLTLDEMIMLSIDSGYETYGIERLGIPATMDNDGPSCVKGRNGLLYVDCGTAYPCETAIACTWNDELAREMGEGVGKEAADIGTDIWYAPGANIHRNPMGGRNFEYFSEDPLISGRMASAIVSGAKSEGLVTAIKHFALNEQESHRSGVFTWADEQTMREIYLKAFEPSIKTGDCDVVMSGYNRIGTKWCGGNSTLLNELLRNEWGFEGFVISDYSSNFFGSGYMDPVLAVYSGNDAILTGIWLLNMPSHKIGMKQAYEEDPIGFGNALREACKNICKVKMETKAFLDDDYSFDSSLVGTLIKPSEWDFSSPFIFSTLRYLLNNILNVVLYAFRYIL